MTEMEIIRERIDTVEDKIETIKTQVEQMHSNVNLMVILLRGNEFDKQDDGMIGEQNDLKRRLERLEKFKDRMFWVMITAAGVTGLNLFQLLDMIIQAFKKG